MCLRKKSGNIVTKYINCVPPVASEMRGAHRHAHTEDVFLNEHMARGKSAALRKESAFTKCVCKKAQSCGS
jgi:hypothetical protein